MHISVLNMQDELCQFVDMGLYYVDMRLIHVDICNLIIYVKMHADMQGKYMNMQQNYLAY